MTADKPEAGRTCICTDEAPPRTSSCSQEAVAGKSYCERCLRSDCEHHWNPSPRPVERCSREEATALRKALEEAIATLEAAPLDEELVCPMRDDEPCGFLPQYLPCWNHRRGATIDIARRALALGGETET